jgi:hypothetical protein
MAPSAFGLTTALREVLESFEQPVPRGLLHGEGCVRLVLLCGLAGERTIQRLEFVRRDDDRATVQVAVSEDREAAENRLVVGVERAVGSAMILIEADLVAAGWKANGLTHDSFVPHVGELRQ